ncbi:DUF4349 domain-containing protein [Ascidiimonas sp. W6]|uniref:DUF4349 domain-containing protein n=1 Tax=Ascidiimonas meishanensis TaxID=3128903 RepID=UPI0030ED64DB
MKIKFLSTLIICILFACSDESVETKDTLSFSPAVSELSNVDSYSEEEVNTYSQKATKSNYKADKQKIILQSYLTFETSDMEKTYQNLAAYIKDNNGYLQSDQSNKNYNRINRTIVARIPSKNFQNVIDSVSKDVSYFDTKNITATDVTEEFIDVSARLKAKKTLEARYLELLTKAKNVKEILEIEKELSIIREEIESREGRLKYLENSVAYSTITVQFYKVSTSKGITISYGSKMWNAVKDGFNGLSVFFLRILHFWPFIVFLLLFIFIMQKKLSRKKKK